MFIYLIRKHTQDTYGEEIVNFFIGCFTCWNSLLPFAWQQEGANSNKKALQAGENNKTQTDATDRIKDELKKFSKKIKNEDQAFWEVKSNTGENFIFTGKLPKEIKNDALTIENVYQLLSNQIKKDIHIVQSSLIKLYFKNILTLINYKTERHENSPQQLQLLEDESRKILESIIDIFPDEEFVYDDRQNTFKVNEENLFSRGRWGEMHLVLNILMGQIVARHGEAFLLIKKEFNKKPKIFTKLIEEIYKFIDVQSNIFFSQVFNQHLSTVKPEDHVLLFKKIQNNDFGFKKASATIDPSDDTTAYKILFIEMLHALDNKLQELLKENKPTEEDEPAVVAEPTHLQNQTKSSEKQKTELSSIAAESKSKAKRKKTKLSATTSESEFSTSAIRAKKRTPLFTGEDDLAGFGNKQKAKNLIKQSIKLASNIKTWLSGSNKILDKRNLDAHTNEGQDEIRRHTIDLASLLDLNKLAAMIKDAKSDVELVNKLTKEFGIAVVDTAKTQNFVNTSDVSTLIDLINKHPNDKLLFLYIPCIVKIKDSTDESGTSISQLPEPGVLELIFNIKDPSAPVCFHNYFIPKASLITSEKYLLNANLKSYFTSFFLQVEKEQETSIEAIENWVNFLQDTKEKNPTEWVSLSINDDEYGLIYNSSNQDRYKWVFCKFNFSPA